ncbi:MAG: hypothetical protein IMZ61_12195 [Planctomycetes bacterium]|nr:hypothetical protein [Planctomycetota bacterium]
MTITYFPFDAGAGANVVESQWSKMARLWRPDGVISGFANLLETYGDSSGMQVKVKTGTAWIEGHYIENDALLTLAIDASHATLHRYDLIVARIDWVNNLGQIAVVKGTAAAVPTVPALTQTFGTTWEIPLATVYIAATVITITAGNVADIRTYSIDGVPLSAISKIASLTGNVVLVDTDNPILSFSPTAARDVTLPAVALTNHPFYILNRNAAYSLTIKNPAAAVIGIVPPLSSMMYFSDGVNQWVKADNLPPSVNVLGNRSAAGEFIQRGLMGTITCSTSDQPIYISSIGVTFAVAFSAAPIVLPGGTTANTNIISTAATNISTTGFTGFVLSYQASQAGSPGFMALGT